MPANCEDCPSYAAATEAATYFKKSPGAPMCRMYGHVLGKPGLKPAAQKKITTAFAGACSSYGQAAPLVTPSRPEAQVAAPDADVIVAGPTPPEDRNAVATCLACANYIAPSAVAESFGWTFGICAASGRLLFPNRLTPEARNCEYRRPGEARSTTASITLKPVYADAFEWANDPVAAFLARRGEDVVDPTVYPTDKEVEPEWADAGVRAWRRMSDPRGLKPDTFLPIYNVDFFDDVERSKIPRTGDDEHPEWFVDYSGSLYKIAVMWRELDETPFLWGMAGVGKTEMFRHLAWLMCLPFDRVSITSSTEVDDLAGKFIANEVNGATVTEFVKGRVPRRWKKPGLLLIDEMNLGPEEVQQFIRPMIDNSKQLVLDMADHFERIERDPSCFLGFTGNPAWDVKNIGANNLADADANRTMHIEVGLPPEKLERAILEKRCEADGYKPSPEDMDKIMSIAKEIRDLVNNGTLPLSWGLRPQIKVARASKWFDLLDCYKVAIADMLEPETRQTLLDVVRRFHTPYEGE
jgi:MoxR-like ATPase